MKTASIYVLVEPRDGEIRYVGWTVKTIAARLRDHLHASLRGDQSYRNRWLSVLRRQRLKPIVRLIQHVCPAEVGYAAERYWIGFFRSAGCRLTNTTDGGEGLLGYKFTPEAKEKMSAAQRQRFADPNERARQQEHLRRVVSDPEARKRRSENQKQIWDERRRQEGKPPLPPKPPRLSRPGDGWNNEARARHSERLKRFYETNPDARAARSRSMKGKKNALGSKRKTGAQLRLPLSTPS